MREIRGWDIGQVVTAAELTLDTANVMEEIGSNGKANLPCIYNGLTLASQSGTGNSIVEFNPGVCRCEDLPLSIFTYLPANAYGNSYACFIDISALDANEIITLSTGITSGYIVGTFTINPTTPGEVDYVVTGSLLQIATGSYNPAIHVRLCSFVYAMSTFTLDFTPGTSRDTDLTGAGGVQWNYQNSSLEINTPASQSGTSIVLKKDTKIDADLLVDNITDFAGTGPVNFSHGITTDSFVAPTQQILVGSGTYTTPTSPRTPVAIRVQMSGGGGGGAGAGVTPGVSGGDGGDTTFASSLLVANGGKGGNQPSGLIALGGTASYSLGIGTAFSGQNGSGGNVFNIPAGTGFVQIGSAGGMGGNSLFAGAGTSSIGAGTDATPFTGGGGGGAGYIASSVSALDIYTGGGGAGGGFLDVIILNPSPTYTFQTGSAGIAGIGPGGNGGVGSAARITVTEYYQ